MKQSLLPLFSFLLLFIAGSFLSFLVRGEVGWTWNTPLAILLVAAFFLSIESLMVLLPIALWTLNWRQVPGVEIVLLVALPVLLAVALRRLPFRGWAAATSSVLVGSLLFWVFVRPEVFLKYSGIVFADIVGSALVGLLVFVALSKFLPKEDTLGDVRRTP